ncbi:MAG: ATPase, partial [Spirochaetales bacterium]|nr:ATPase [Spirochaetales bacterium]
KIISYLTTIPPGELNRNNIAKYLEQDNKTVQNYLNILHETGIINLIKEMKIGSNLLKTKEKIYLNNPDIYHAVSEEIGIENRIGAIREIFFINMIRNSENKIFYSNIGDFEINGIYFEIGGRKKSIKQIKEYIDNSFIVKDDIIYYEKNTIPLMYFGFLY